MPWRTRKVRNNNGRLSTPLRGPNGRARAARGECFHHTPHSTPPKVSLRAVEPSVAMCGVVFRRVQRVLTSFSYKPAWAVLAGGVLGLYDHRNDREPRTSIDLSCVSSRSLSVSFSFPCSFSFLVSQSHAHAHSQSRSRSRSQSPILPVSQSPSLPVSHSHAQSLILIPILGRRRGGAATGYSRRGRILASATHAVPSRRSTTRRDATRRDAARLDSARFHSTRLDSARLDRYVLSVDYEEGEHNGDAIVLAVSGEPSLAFQVIEGDRR